jgi:hypothetical protein
MIRYPGIDPITGNIDPVAEAQLLNNTLIFPNSKAAKHLRWAYINSQQQTNAAAAIINSINTATVSAIVNTSGLCTYPTAPSLPSSLVWFDGRDLTDAGKANGNSISSFTDKVGNIFTWVGATPPVYSAVTATGCPNSYAGLNFVSAVGFYSSLILTSAVDPGGLRFSQFNAIYQLKSTSTSANQVLFDFSTVSTSDLSYNAGYGFAPVLSSINLISSIGVYPTPEYSIVSGTNPIYGLICRVAVSDVGHTYYSGLGAYGDGRFGVPYTYIFGPSSNSPEDCYMPGSAIIDVGKINYAHGEIYSFFPSGPAPQNYIAMNPLHTCVQPNGKIVQHGAIGRDILRGYSFMGTLLPRGICFIGRGSAQSSGEQFKGFLAELLIIDQYNSGQPHGPDNYGVIYPYYAGKYHPSTSYATTNPSCSGCNWLYYD